MIKVSCVFPKQKLCQVAKPFLIILTAGLTGCAVQAPPVAQKDAPQSLATQKAAQQAVALQAPATPTLKRKIALGRITNETSYGQSLLRDQHDDPLGKQVTDLMSKALTESGAYLVFERPDIGRIQAEGRLTDTKLNIVGVDALIIGSLTEFGRKAIGATGFVSSSKRQVAFAKVDIRVVDVNTGHVFFATSGAGEASTETASTFGFGSQAGYDGMQFSVQTQGEQVKSPQTGAMVTLPGQAIAQIRVDALFGDSELNEGAVASIASGSLTGYKPEQLLIRFEGAK